MIRLADAEEREGTPAERPRVDAERERVKILERGRGGAGAGKRSGPN